MKDNKPVQVGQRCEMKDGRVMYVLFVNRPGNGYAVHVSELNPKQYANSPLDERTLESHPWHKFRKLAVLTTETRG